MAVRILVDSTFDFTDEQLALTGIEVVRLHVNFGGEELVDGVDITPEGFYERLIESTELPTTSQASPADFAERFESLTAAGDDVVCMTLSSKLSGTYQSAVIAAADYPGRVRVVDTLSVALGSQILARYAYRLAAGGRTMDEIADECAAVRGRICLMALLDTLEYLKRGGRISGTAAFAGTVLSIKPVVAIRDGEVAVIGKARGSRNGENLLSQTIEKFGVDFEMPYLLGYTGISDALLQKYKADSARLWEGHAKDLPVSIVGSVIGTHAGPNAIAVAFFRQN